MNIPIMILALNGSEVEETKIIGLFLLCGCIFFVTYIIRYVFLKKTTDEKHFIHYFAKHNAIKCGFASILLFCFLLSMFTIYDYSTQKLSTKFQDTNLSSEKVQQNVECCSNCR